MRFIIYTAFVFFPKKFKLRDSLDLHGQTEPDYNVVVIYLHYTHGIYLY